METPNQPASELKAESTRLFGKELNSLYQIGITKHKEYDFTFHEVISP